MTQPSIKIPLNRLDWLLEGLAVLVMLGLIIIPARNYSSLPDTIPIHFDAAGKVNGYGAKPGVWILPFTSLIVYGALTIMQQYPHKVNYIIGITLENAKRQYRNMLNMIRTMKLLVLLVLIYLMEIIIQAAQNGKVVVNSWFLPLTLIAVFSVLIIFFVRSYRMR